MHNYFTDEIDDIIAKEQKQINTSYLLFTVCDETFGLQINDVQVIIQKPDLRKIPDMPPYITGLTNYIRKIYPVMDTRKRFQMPFKVVSNKTPVILIKSGEMHIGIIVDNILEVSVIEEKEISCVPQEKTGFFNRFVKGIVQKEATLIYIIDCNTLFVNEKEYIEELNSRNPDEIVNGGNLDA